MLGFCFGFVCSDVYELCRCVEIHVNISTSKGLLIQDCKHLFVTMYLEIPLRTIQPSWSCLCSPIEIFGCYSVQSACDYYSCMEGGREVTLARLYKFLVHFQFQRWLDFPLLSVWGQGQLWWSADWGWLLGRIKSLPELVVPLSNIDCLGGYSWMACSPQWVVISCILGIIYAIAEASASSISSHYTPSNWL